VKVRPRREFVARESQRREKHVVTFTRERVRVRLGEDRPARTQRLKDLITVFTMLRHVPESPRMAILASLPKSFADTIDRTLTLDLQRTLCPLCLHGMTQFHDVRASPSVEPSAGADPQAQVNFVTFT